MNYFAHALPFLDRPYLAVATGIPDMLTVVDRQVRVRSKHVEPFVDDAEPVRSAVACGVVQHLNDDRLFHATRAFTELSMAMAIAARDVLADESSPRPRFLGHLLVEVLLDAVLIAEWPKQLEAYYRALEAVDAHAMQRALNQMVPRPSRHLADMIRAVRRERFLWDYLEDDTLMVRLNQIMRRVRLEALPPEFQAVLPTARRQVAVRRAELLAGIALAESRPEGLYCRHVKRA